MAADDLSETIQELLELQIQGALILYGVAKEIKELRQRLDTLEKDLLPRKLEGNSDEP